MGSTNKRSEVHHATRNHSSNKHGGEVVKMVVAEWPSTFLLTASVSQRRMVAGRAEIMGSKLMKVLSNGEANQEIIVLSRHKRNAKVASSSYTLCAEDNLPS